MSTPLQGGVTGGGTTPATPGSTAPNPVGTQAQPGASTTTYNAQGNYTNNQMGTGASSAMNQFTPQQQQLQQSLPGMLQGYLSGTQQVPSYMTAPPQVFQAYNDAFSKYVAPGIAAQYGAGSPQMGAQQSFGNEQLAAQLYQSGLQNYMSGLQLGGNWMYNPIGQLANSASNTSGGNTSNVLGVQSTSPSVSVLSYILGLIGQGMI